MKILIPGVMVVILSDDRSQVLLHLRDDNGLWSLPGGSAEYGETIEELAAREVYEEVGINIKVIRCFGIYSSPEKFTFNYADGNSVHSYVIGIEARKTSGEEKPNSSDSIDVAWFPVRSLPQNLMQMQYEVIEDALFNGEFLLK